MIQQDSYVRALKNLTDIYGTDLSKELLLQFTDLPLFAGVGTKTARKWYQKGYHTVEDVRSSPPEDINQSQIIGLKYYNDLQQK
jgi:replicative superfamily II helicase